MNRYCIFYLLLGILIGDFIVAFGHWFEDNYLYYDIKIKIPILSGIINDISKGNDLHHYVPRLLTQKSYLDTIMSTAKLLPIILIIYLCIPGRTSHKNIMILIGISFMILISEITHRWMHYRNCEKNNSIRFLQSTILVSSEEHRIHHTDEAVTRDYGVIFKHLNRFYNFIGIWPFLESIIPNLCKKTNNFHNKPILDDCPYKMSNKEKEKYRRQLYNIRKNNIIPKCYN